MIFYINILSGFCHFVLVLFMVLWQSPDTPVMSCFHVRLRVCSSRALSHLRTLFHVGAWCSDPGTHVLSFVFVSGFGHSRSVFCLIVWVCGLEFARPPLFCPRVFCCVAHCLCFYRLRAFMLCLVLCGTQLVYSLAVCFRVFMSCVNTWLMSILISCVFVSCFAHGWWFVCWPCAWVFVSKHGFCLSFLCAMCSHVNLSWPHSSCFLIIGSFAPPVFPCYPPHLLVLYSPCVCSPMPVNHQCYPGCIPPCLVLASQAFALFLFFPLRSIFWCWFSFILLIKAHLLHPWVLASSLHPTPLTHKYISQFLQNCSLIMKIRHIFVFKNSLKSFTQQMFTL